MDFPSLLQLSIWGRRSIKRATLIVLDLAFVISGAKELSVSSKISERIQKMSRSLSPLGHCHKSMVNNIYHLSVHDDKLDKAVFTLSQ